MAIESRKDLTMNETIGIVAESIATDKARHIGNAVATGTAATVGATGSLVGEILGWLPHIAVAVGLLVSCALFYKTYLEIQLARVRLAKEGRREKDQPSKPVVNRTLKYSCKRKDDADN